MLGVWLYCSLWKEGVKYLREFCNGLWVHGGHLYITLPWPDPLQHTTGTKHQLNVCMRETGRERGIILEFVVVRIQWRTQRIHSLYSRIHSQETFPKQTKSQVSECLHLWRPWGLTRRRRWCHTWRPPQLGSSLTWHPPGWIDHTATGSKKKKKDHIYSLCCTIVMPYQWFAHLNNQKTLSQQIWL